MRATPGKFKIEVVAGATARPEERAIWMFSLLPRAATINKQPELYKDQFSDHC